MLRGNVESLSGCRRSKIDVNWFSVDRLISSIKTITMRFFSFLLFVFIAASSAQAAVVTYVEAADGPLSNSSFGPTELGEFDHGINTVDAGLQDTTGPADVFTFEIKSGQELTAIVLTDFDTGDPLNPDRMFFGIHDAETFPVSTGDMLSSMATGNEFLGGILMGTSLNTNLMPAIGAGQTPPLFIGTGFTGNLGEGNYTAYLQQTSSTNTQYTLAFNVTAIPEPSTTFGLLAAMGWVIASQYRKRRLAQPHSAERADYEAKECPN